MEAKVFKQLVSGLFREMGFESQQNSFYKRDEEIIYVIGLQKSNNSNGFYFNVGYVIKDLCPELYYPKFTDGHVRARFNVIQSTEKETDIVELDQLSSESKELIKIFLQKNIENLIDPVQSNGLAWLLKRNPVMLYQTTVKAKEYLHL